MYIVYSIDRSFYPFFNNQIVLNFYLKSKNCGFDFRIWIIFRIFIHVKKKTCITSHKSKFPSYNDDTGFANFVACLNYNV